MTELTTEASAPPALVLDGVSVARGGRTVWSHGTFTVRAGAVVGVIGPNGAGKTTMFQVALGLLPVTAGRVEVLGARRAAATAGSATCRRTTPRPSATRSAAATW